ncbi:MAG: 6-bladed beta-propeller [Candidatus Aminicenantes bacterium]|nr:6-bladed beta-propeller [Candidatus Aminicenantes bacterium]NIM78459.1 6-bladed beta-propeller [Candidatus Aminicenantes bacterium]NIN17722.1 6-bladed beta-propeller [Candidatus Aminicenantes bacterium]NIN41598.1 6-bladed beta-propeller [Candidatus Aminicenantes bacterium]NIN84372.1 6-bladed beta-propeller [Candidatus Aminicenantes bacterium]
MKRCVGISVTFLLFLSFFLHGKNFKLNQKKGIWQDKEEKHIEFVSFERINLDFEKVPLKKVMKVTLHKSNIFILDGKRNELYVMDKNGKYLYTIGRPGQGPGDIEFGCDFYISEYEKIYVLSSFSKRIEVFDIKGKPLSSIKLKPPDVWMSAKSILLNQNNNFIIGSSYDRIIATYSIKGDFIKTVLKHDDLEMISKSQIGINTKLCFIDNKILLFDAFRGIFVKLSMPGDIESVFSGFSYKVTPQAARNEEQVRSLKTPKGVSRHLNILSWTNFCVDGSNNIYVMPLGVESDGNQNLFVFSLHGTLLYKKPMDFFKKNKVRHICCDSDHFLFMTKNFDLIRLCASLEKQGNPRKTCYHWNLQEIDILRVCL